MQPKTLATVVLSTFVVVSLAFAISRQLGAAPEATASIATEAQFVVFYLHGAKRCATCMAMEAYTREAVESDFAEPLEHDTLAIRTVDFSLPENEALAKEYGVSFSSIAVAELRDGKTVRFKLLDQTWDLVGDKNTFMAYVATEVRTFMEQP